MSKEVESRVVELDLDNKKFEKNAQQSIKTLEKLDDALVFKNGVRSFREVEEAAEQTNFASLINAAETVSDRLSNLGIVGVTALTNITNRAVDAGVNLAKSLSVDQISAGYAKYEEKTANVQTIMNATGKSVDEVNSYLEKLLWYSDETSYGFTDMQSAFASMVSSGGDVDRMASTITGFGNAVSFAGKGAAELKQALRFSVQQAYAKGYMLSQDWSTLQTMNIDSTAFRQSLIDAAKAVGMLDEYGRTIEKGTEITATNLPSTLAEKWLTNDVWDTAMMQWAEYSDAVYEASQITGEFSDTYAAMDALSGKFSEIAENGFKSGQSAKSFTEAVDAVKDAVSTGWMETFELIFGNYEQAVELWTNLTEGMLAFFNGGTEFRNNLLRDALGGGAKSAEEMSKSLLQTVDDFQTFRSVVVETAKAQGALIEGNGETILGFQDLLKQEWASGDLIADALEKYADGLDSADRALTAEEKLAKVRDILENEVNKGKYGGGVEEQTRRLKEAGYELDNVQQWYNAVAHNDLAYFEKMMLGSSEATNDSADSLRELAMEARSVGEAFGEERIDGRTLLLQGFANILTSITSRIDLLKESWNSAFPPMTADRLYQIIVQFESFTSKLKMGETETRILGTVLTAFFTILSKIWRIVGGVANVMLAAGRAIGRFRDYILSLKPVQEFLGRLSDRFSFLYGNATRGLDSVRDGLDWIAELIDSLDEHTFSRLFSNLPGIFSLIGRGIQWVGQMAKILLFAGLSKFPGIELKIAKYAAPILGYLQEFANNCFPVLLGAFAAMTAFGLGIYNDLLKPFADFIKVVAKSEKPLKTLKDGVVNYLKKFKESNKYVQAAKEKFEELKVAIKPITDLLSDLGAKAEETKGKLDFKTVLAALTAAGSLYGLYTILNTMKSVSKLADTVTTTFKNLNNITKSKFGGPFANNLKSIAGSVLILAAAVTILSRIEKDRLWPAIGAMAVLVVVLTAFSGIMAAIGVVLDKKKITTSFKQFAPLMVSLAIGIIALAFAAKQVSEALGDDIGLEHALAIVVTVAGLGLALVGLTTLLSHYGAKFTFGALAMIAIGFAIYEVAKALNLIQSIELSDDVKQLANIAVIFGALAAFMSKVGGGGISSSFLNVMVGLLSCALALYATLAVLEKLKEFTLPDFKEKGAEILAVFVTLFAVLLTIGIVGKYVKAGTRALLSISVAMVAMVGTMFLIEKLLEKIAALGHRRGIESAGMVLAELIIAMGLFTVLFGAAVALTDKGKGLMRLAVSMILMTMAFGIMIGLFAVVYKMVDGTDESAAKMEKSGNLLFQLGVLFGIMVLAAGYAAKLGQGKGIGVIVAVTAGLVALVMMLITLTAFSWDDLQGPMYAMIGIAFALGIALVALGFAVQMATSGEHATVRLIAVAIMFGALGFALASVSKYPWQQIAAAGGAMAGVIAVLGIVLGVLNKVKISGKTYAGFVLIIAATAGAMWVMAAALKPLMKYSWQKFLTQMAIMVGGIVVLALALVGLGKLASNPMIMAGVAVVALALGTVALVLGATALVIGVFALAVKALADIDLPRVALGIGELSLAFMSVAVGGLLMIPAALGVFLFTLALNYMAKWAPLTAGNIALMNIAMIGFLNTISAVGNAFANSDGSILKGLANLRSELHESAEATLNDANLIGESLSAAYYEIPDVSEPVVTGIEDVSENAVAAVQDAESDLQQAATEAVESTTEAVAEAVKSDDTTSKVGDAVMGLIGSVVSDKLSGDKLTFVGDLVSGNLVNAIGNSALSKAGVNKDILSGDFTSLLEGSFGNMDFSGIAQSGVNNLIPAISDEMGSDFNLDILSDAGLELGEEAAEGLGSTDTTSEGNNFVLGFVNRISSGECLGWARDAATNLGLTANNALQESIDSHSPSRVTEELGGFFGEGFVIGLNVWAINAAKAAMQVGQRAVKALDGEIQNSDVSQPVLDMSEVYASMANMDDDIWRPVIKPTLDMSDVNPAMSNLNAVASYRSQGYGGYSGTSQNYNTTNYSPTVNVYPAAGQNSDEIATAVMNKIQFEYQKKAGVWR